MHNNNNNNNNNNVSIHKYTIACTHARISLSHQSLPLQCTASQGCTPYSTERAELEETWSVLDIHREESRGS